MKIWKGLEQEDSLKTPTLFIQGSTVNIDKILEIAKEQKIFRLYFGAGKVEFTEFDKLFLIPDNYKIVVETTYPQQISDKLKDKIHIVLRIESISLQNLKPCMTTIKFENYEFITSTLMSNMYLTVLNNYNPSLKMYFGDKVLYKGE